MKRGKSINLFLMDGDADGRIKCTLANWTGVAYRIPRTDLEKCKDRKDLKQSGVYLLFGVSDDSDRPVVYVGQAGARKNGEGLLNRIVEHKKNPDKDYWTEAVALTTTNNSFGQTEISYLENRFCKLADAAGRYLVKNGIDPTSGNITEEKECELEEFIEYARMIVGTLGHKVFVPLAKHECAASDTDDTPPAATDTALFLERTIRKLGLTVKAQGRQTSEGFVVLAGSTISPIESNVPPGISARRSRAQVDENHVLTEDMLFKSPSGAADFVIGNSANGWTSWKTEDGKTLRELENEEAQTAETSA